MSDALKILIVGGYGTFGGRMVALRENAPGLTLIIAGDPSLTLVGAKSPELGTLPRVTKTPPPGRTTGNDDMEFHNG